MAQTYDYVQETDTTKTTVSYTCEPGDMRYTIIGDDIKADFDFLIKDIPAILDEMLRNVAQASNIDDAFYFENGAKAQNLANLYEEIRNDVSTEKNNLTRLHQALMTDIDNINAELEDNFGHIMFYDIQEAGRVVEDKTN